MSASYPTKIILAMRSGNVCAMKTCRISLTADGHESDLSLIGEAAHIYGESSGTKTKKASARYKANMTDEKRNHYDNLIYLCPTCHTIIDKQEEDYPAEMLYQLKAEHEAWVDEQLDIGMSDVTFTELDVAANAIASGQHSGVSDFHVLPPEEKISKNSLGAVSKAYISMGLSRSAEVSKFLSQMSLLDSEFPIRLKDGFQQKYLELKQTLSGDELFMGVLEFSQTGQKDFKQQAASLALLSHLFHLCEVFEK